MNAESLANFENRLDFDKAPQEVLHCAVDRGARAQQLSPSVHLSRRDLHIVVLGRGLKLLHTRNFLIIQVLERRDFLAANLIRNLPANLKLKAID